MSKELETRRLLALHNLVIVEVPRDGNCLFHSLSSFMADNNTTHFSLRTRLVKFIASRASEFSSVVDPSVYSSFAHYLTSMSQPGHYGDGTMIDAFSLLFNVNVVIFNDGRFYETLPEAKINIALYWNRQQQHYQPAIPDPRRRN